MISKSKKEAFVWIWLPYETQPVVAGKLTFENKLYIFNYGKSYLERENAISIYSKELPLKKGPLYPLPGLMMPSSLRDSAPDAWGRRVILNKLSEIEVDNELIYFLESGSDRIGALDFQCSPTHYESRCSENISLDELQESAMRIEQGVPFSAELDQALCHGSSVGGARPKALVKHDNKKYIAKFSLSTDLYNFIKIEFISMRLAELVGLCVAPVTLTKSLHKDVLLVERFDRRFTVEGWQRKMMLSALTLLELDEMMARYASYEKLAEIIRYQFKDASQTLKELFSRLIFNIFIGNTDDHARNHSAFWDGSTLSLSPAYDLCPQSRIGQVASQAMLISNQDRSSRLATCLDAAPYFLLSEKEAVSIIEHQLKGIGRCWSVVCEQAHLDAATKKSLVGRQFLNPFIFEGLNEKQRSLKRKGDEVREQMRG
ncbi:MAG: type II toxin-antitoxin system HipA family toxin [Gammaproteobacteria bacterium]|nr:type II toxin-antitoxin system HipA family toxin [Gammaproteobacteria bacterium]